MERTRISEYRWATGGPCGLSLQMAVSTTQRKVSPSGQLISEGAVRTRYKSQSSRVGSCTLPERISNS